MHSLSISLLTCLALVLGTATSFSQENLHVGKWEGELRGDSVGVLFEKDGHIAVFKDGKEVKPEMKGEDSIIALYKIDYTKSPIWLDIIAIDATGEEIMRGLMIMKFVGKDEMVLQGHKREESVRPENFDEQGKRKKVTMRLRRVSQANPDGVK